MISLRKRSSSGSVVGSIIAAIIVIQASVCSSAGKMTLPPGMALQIAALPDALGRFGAELEKDDTD